MTTQTFALAQATNNFGFRLYQECNKEGSQRGIVSPLSLVVALAVLINGAKGKTYKAIADAVGVAGEPHLAMQNAQNADLIALLTKGDPKMVLDIPNSVWYRPDVELQSSFKAIGKNVYDAMIDKLVSIKGPNDWVNKSTRAMIPTILDHLDSSQKLLLLNVVFEKEHGTAQFLKAETQHKSFTTLAGSKLMVPMMSQFREMHYQTDNGIQSVRLALGSENEKADFAVYFVMPPKGSNLIELQKTLTSESKLLNKAAMHFGHGTLELPRTSTHYDTDLVEPMTNLGMGIAFDDRQADFSGMFANAEGTCITGVRQKTACIVDENGFTGAAVTAIGFGAKAVHQQPVEEFQMIVDRPYLLVAKEDNTGAITFIGPVDDPGTAGQAI